MCWTPPDNYNTYNISNNYNILNIYNTFGQL